jgi:hypothetical protein
MEASGAIDPMEGIWLFLWSDVLPTTGANVDEMLTKKENWPELVALTSFLWWSCRESNQAHKMA